MEFVQSALTFVRDNFVQIIVVLITAGIAYGLFYLSTYSLKKLRIGVFSTYPFRLFFPEERQWSTGYFLIIIILLGILVYLGFKGNFLAGPA